MTPVQREELKACPFCGGSVSLEKYTKDSNMGPRSWWGVKCRNTINLGGTCAIEQNPSGSPEAAIERWNRRAQVEALTVPQGWERHVVAVRNEPQPPYAVMMYFDSMGSKREFLSRFGAPTIPAIPGTKEGS